MRFGHLGLAASLIAALVTTAAANGRDPFASSVHFTPGNPSKIMAGMTFGLIRSDDGGATWQWYCEKNVGYGGTYDPDYDITSSGAVFATTFDGLKVMRDGCTFAATPPGMTFVSRVVRGPDNAVYFAASDLNDSKIYKSTNDGVSFDISATPGMLNDWWQSIEVAPSNASRVYISGYRTPLECTMQSSNPGTPCTMNTECPGGTCEPQKQLLAFRSDTGGTDGSYTAMDLTDITPTSMNSALDIVGIDPNNEDILYARVTLETPTSGERIWKSTDGGQNWTSILAKTSNIGGLSFVVRNDGSCVAGTRDVGAWKSPYVADEGCGATWTELTTAPHIGCLYNDAANDEVWACTQNTASPQLGITSDGFGLMKSADLATWTGMLKFEDIQKPVACAADSTQQTECVDRTDEHQSAWCCLISQLGLTSTAVDCSGLMACFAQPEPATDAGTMVMKPEPGCCDSSAAPSPSAVLLMLLVTGTLLLRRKRPAHR